MGKRIRPRNTWILTGTLSWSIFAAACGGSTDGTVDNPAGTSGAGGQGDDPSGNGAGAGGKNGGTAGSGTVGQGGKSGSGAGGGGSSAGGQGGNGEGGTSPGGGSSGSGGQGAEQRSEINLSATVIDFGLAPCGGVAPASKTLKINNSGNAPLTVSVVTSGSSAFAVEGSTSAVILPGNDASFAVSVLPISSSSTAGVTAQGTLLITSNDPTNKNLSVPLSVTPQGVTLALGTPTLDFGQVSFNTPAAPVPVTLKNIGNLSANVTFGPASDLQFFLSSPGGTLDPGQSLMGLNANFTPTTIAESSAQIPVGLPANTPLCGGSIAAISLTGEGVVGAFSISGDLGFGATLCGATAPAQKVKIRNSGNGSYTFTAVLAKGDASPYTLSPTSGAVASQSSFELTVTPKAIPGTSQVPGNYSDSIAVQTQGIPGDDAPHLLNITQSASGAILTFDPPSVAFGSASVGNTQNASVNVRNGGDVKADVSLQLDNGAIFGITPATGISVGPNQQQGATVSFTAANTSAQSGLLSLATSTTLCQPLPAPVALSGTGLNGGVSLDTTTLDFGQISCGATAAAKQVTLSNSGNAPLTWNAALGQASSFYTFSPASGSLDPGASVAIVVTPTAVPQISPITPNFYGDVLTLLTNVVGDSPHDIKLQETARGAILQFAQASLDFGSIPVSTTTKQTTALVNIGNATANVSFASSNSVFVPVPTGPVATSGNGATTALEVDYTTGAAPASNQGNVSVQVASGDVLCAPLPTALVVTGTAITGVVSYSPSSLDFGGVFCGSQAAPKQITFTNTGNAPYTITLAKLGKGAQSPYQLSPTSGTVPAKAGNVNGTLTFTVTPKAIPQSPATGISGDYSDTLSVSTDVAGDSPNPKEIALGEFAQGSIVVLTNPANGNIGFGNVVVGTKKSYLASFKNNGNFPTTLKFIQNNQSSAYSFDQGVTLTGGEEKTIGVNFIPTVASTINETASLAVSNTTLCAPLPNVTQNNNLKLSGNGVNQATLSVSPTTVNFNGVGCNTQAAARTIVLSNSSTQTVTWTPSFSSSNGATSALDYIISPAGGTIPAGGQATLTLTPPKVPFPSTPGQQFPDTLRIGSNAPGTAQITVNLNQSAVGGALSYVGSGGGNSIAFLNVANTANGKSQFILRNSGNATVSFTSTLSNALFALNTTDQVLTANAAPSNIVFFKGTPGSTGNQSKVTLTLQGESVLCQPLPELLFFSPN